MSLKKISRWGQSFWVEACREVEPDVWVGTIANDLGTEPPLTLGDTVAFVGKEIVETRAASTVN